MTKPPPTINMEYSGDKWTNPDLGEAVWLGAIPANSTSEVNLGAAISTYPNGPLIRTTLMWRDDVGAVRQPCSWGVTVMMFPGAEGSITMSGKEPTVEAAERVAKKAWPRLLKQLAKTRKGKKKGAKKR